jgi:hypothetical protein
VDIGYFRGSRFGGKIFSGKEIAQLIQGAKTPVSQEDEREQRKRSTIFGDRDQEGGMRKACI